MSQKARQGSPQEEIRQRLAARKAVVVVGAGVSHGASGRRPEALWTGLLESGIDACATQVRGVLASWVARQREALAESIEHGDLDEMVGVADAVTRKLGGRESPAFSKWLEESVGGLKVADPAVLEALGGLGVPLATTNYDSLLTEATGRPAVTWRQPERLLAVLTGEEPGIAHLHGHFRDPASVILDSRSYEQVVSNQAAQAVQTGLALFHSLLFVGCGAGLADPNFGGLLAWLRTHVPGQRHRHYRLCRDGEADDLRREHGGDKITVLPYGEDHDRLAPYLAELRPAAATGTGKEAIDALPPIRLRPYLQALISRTNHINISGIVTSQKGALRHAIEKLYTPLSSRGEVELDLAGGHRGPGAARVRLEELLPRHRRLLIEGQPGAGKTTFLRLVACMLARDALGLPCPDGSSWRGRHLGLGGEDAPTVPILLRVSELVALLLEEEGPRFRHDNRQWLLDLLERSCEEDGHAVPREHWEKVLTSGEAVLLLDGLDEAADLGVRERIFAIFRDACEHWPCPVVVTSRPLHTGPLKEMGFHVSTIEAFGETEIRTFLDHWVTALHAAESEGFRQEAERYRQGLETAILSRPRVKLLATNPVMLTCLCVVHWNEGELPEGRSRVYRAVLHWLIAAKSPQRTRAGFTDRFALRAFARLALSMMSAEAGKRPVLGLEEAAVAVEPVVVRDFPNLVALADRRQRAREWLVFEGLGSGIVEEIAGRRIRFWHLTFQEYLAALQLALLGDGEDASEDWWPHLQGRLSEVQWRETVELFPGTLFDEGGEQRVDRLLERVFALRGSAPELVQEAKVTGILGRLLQPLRIVQYQPPREISAAYEATLRRVEEIFTVEGAAKVPVKVRIAAADALGQGGDPRLAPDRNNFLPLPGRAVRLGQYPVTVEEYQRFVESRGYEEPRHWSTEGWRQRQKGGWEAPGSWEKQLEHPNRPVVQVSWWEAEAYGRWLSGQRGGEYRLPTEAEWEAAATSREGPYPWGEAKPDAERANFDGNEGAPTPVGIYPSGDGPYDHRDLAGNVWEWCADEAEEMPWAKGEPTRVNRGGGWLGPAESLGSAFRGWSHAWRRNGDLGFRLVASSASS